MTEQLKPCPCCGAEAKLQPQTHFTQSYSIHGGIKYVYVMCSECSLSSDDVEDWNSRPSPWVPVGREHIDGTHYLCLCPTRPFEKETLRKVSFIDGSFMAGNHVCTHVIPLPPAPETKGE